MNIVTKRKIIEEYFVDNVPLWMIAKKHDVSMHYVIKLIDMVIKIRRDV